jgi:hypothetical protein
MKYMVCIHSGREIGHYDTEAGAVVAAVDISLQTGRTLNVYPVERQTDRGPIYGLRVYVARGGRIERYRTEG